jgi:hypothetical protein
MLFRFLAEAGHEAGWLVVYFACLIGVFVLYIGIAMWFTFRARNAEQRQIRYQVFRDLRDLFFPWERRKRGRRGRRR